MGRRFKARSGINKIECALCGTFTYSDMIQFTKHTHQAICAWHRYDENFDRPGPVNVAEASVPMAQSNEVLDYDSIQTPTTLTTLDGLLATDANG